MIYILTVMLLINHSMICHSKEPLDEYINKFVNTTDIDKELDLISHFRETISKLKQNIDMTNIINNNDELDKFVFYYNKYNKRNELQNELNKYGSRFINRNQMDSDKEQYLKIELELKKLNEELNKPYNEKTKESINNYIHMFKNEITSRYNYINNKFQESDIIVQLYLLKIIYELEFTK